MSRVANLPIKIFKDISVKLDENKLMVSSKQSTLFLNINPSILVEITSDKIFIKTKSSDKLTHAMAGTTRALINNMMYGVSNGFEKKLILVGVGYKVQLQNNILNLSLGFSHPIQFLIPEGIKIETPSQTEIVIKGSDKQQVGQVAANIRSYRPPEPYKGKGIKYFNEQILRKEAKKK